jgi:antitoxin (DNA-binding transcriptional repressor) of toxin-antitoxin stability system
MSHTITQRQLRNDRGESYVVTRNGAPVGELTPVRRRRFVPSDLVAAAFRNAPRVDAERFRADLDAVVDQSAIPRG